VVADSNGNEDVVKHWRQDWIYENDILYTYDRDNKWNFTKLKKESTKGQWTQKVFQVDDSPRYEANGTWVHVDGRHFWESVSDSPLPRREFSVRSDYNVLRRRNRHEITSYGWVHEQDNDKINVSDNSRTLIAQEKGWNTYTKTDIKRCQTASNYWKKYSDFWKFNRQQWDLLYNKNQDLILHPTVDNMPLFMHIFQLNPEEKEKITLIIPKFIKSI
jgi:hypothetical protein